MYHVNALGLDECMINVRMKIKRPTTPPDRTEGGGTC